MKRKKFDTTKVGNVYYKATPIFHNIRKGVNMASTVTPSGKDEQYSTLEDYFQSQILMKPSSTVLERRQRNNTATGTGTRSRIKNLLQPTRPVNSTINIPSGRIHTDQLRLTGIGPATVRHANHTETLEEPSAGNHSPGTARPTRLTPRLSNSEEENTASNSHYPANLDIQLCVLGD
jgi:hypothetical protein